MPRNLHPAEARKRKLFLDRTAAALGVRADQAERMLSGELRSSVRINRLHARPADEIAEELSALTELQPIAWCPDAYHIFGDKRAITASTMFADGQVYVQNASSLIPGLALAAEPGHAILDVCSSPGGKAAHIAALTRNQAQLWVNDGIKPRLNKLRDVVDLMAMRIEDMTNIPGQYLDKMVERKFDRILLDAQCSGEGMVNLERSDSLRYWTLERIEKISRLQQRMLVAAFKCLAPGGVLVYCTCTIAPEENEAPVDHLVRHYETAVVEPIPVDIPEGMAGLESWDKRSFDPELRHAMRIMPSPFFEAFFICRIRKRAEAA